MAINITFSSFQFNALALGNLILLPAIFSLKKIAFRDTLDTFTHLAIIFLLFETTLLMLHLTFKYPPLYAELLFHSKFAILLGFYYWLGRDYKNIYLKLIWWSASLLLLAMIFVFLFLIYFDYQFLFSFARFRLSGKINSIISLTHEYQNSITLFVYLQHVLPIIFLALNLVLTAFFYTHKEKIFSRYYKLMQRLQNKYQGQ